jgi:hypothetical protein
LFGWLSRRDTPSVETTALLALTELAQEFLSQHRSWSEKMLTLEAEKLRLEQTRLEGVQPLSGVPMGQLRVSEDEQDADWALRTGIIEPHEYNEILSKAGLAPSDIEFM